MKNLIRNEFWEIDKCYNIDTVLYLLVDRPDKITIDSFVWYSGKNCLYREYNLPPIIWTTY